MPSCRVVAKKWRHVAISGRATPRARPGRFTPPSGAGDPGLNDYDLYGVIRLGSDFINNFYEIKIPLRKTKFNSSLDTDIWPDSNNLSLALPVAPDMDTDSVWSTQWFIPSSTDPNGGKNLHVYAESNNGAALRCYVGENAVLLVGGGGILTYPGNSELTGANCQSTLGPNGF